MNKMTSEQLSEYLEEDREFSHQLQSAIETNNHQRLVDLMNDAKDYYHKPQDFDFLLKKAKQNPQMYDYLLSTSNYYKKN